MRILYVSHAVRDPLKGAAYADLALLGALRERGHDVDEAWDIGAPRLVRHDNLHLLLEAPRKCEQVVRGRLNDKQYDVVLVNQPLGWRTGRVVAKSQPAPLYLARSHGWEPRAFEKFSASGEGHDRSLLRRIATRCLRPFLNRQNSRVLALANGLIVGSKEDREWIIQANHYPEARILPLPPGLPPEFVTSGPRSLSPERMKRLLYVGQFAAIKGPAVAAAAMVSILRREVGVTATWVCAQSDHEKVAALFPEALRARVALVGWLPREELVRVYDEHGIFIFASHFEGFGQTFLEAMARGMVVLATRVGGMREVIRDGENGFLFDFGASIRIAEKALEVISNPVLAKEVSAAARKTAEAFTWARSAERFEEFVHNLGEPSIAGSPSPGVHPDHGRPAVSVVIPTYQRERVLLDTLGYLLALATKPAEIVVVDQTVCHLDDTDGELKRLQEEGLIRWIRLTKPSIPRAMNTGLEQALCEVVLFLDDDIVPSEGLIRVHQDAHSSGEHDIVVGQVLQPGERPMEAGGSFGPFRFNSNLRQVVPGVMAGNLSVRRSKALSLGGFDENFVRAAYCFETEFADRARQAGEHILFEPAASIRHLKATEGGTRVWGEHLRTIRPGHSVGAFYYLLRSPRVGNRMLGLLYRPLRAIRTKHHLQRPWWIPVTLIAEMLGLLWAVGLFLRGPRRLGWNGGLSECR